MTIDIDAEALLASPEAMLAARTALMAEELKSEKTFDARAAVTGATYPQDSIDVYADAKLAHELNVATHEAVKARHFAESIKSSYIRVQTELGLVEQTVEDETPAIDGTKAPGYDEADKEASDLEAGIPPLLEKLRETVLTFHLRGLAPEQWRLIHAKWRKEIKPPARKNFELTEEGEEEFQRVTYERDLARLAAIKEDTIASSITKVVRKHDGATDTSVWKQPDVKNINDLYLESEFDKLETLVAQLTWAKNLFQIAVEQDADFLSKP